MQTQKIAILVFSIVLMSYIVSAGFFDKITGLASSQKTNVTVQVSGRDQCQVTSVSPISATTPIEANYTTVTFYVNVYDKNGYKDINLSATFANFSYSINSNEFRKTAANCSLANQVDNKNANFTCRINMWYWDGAGAWNVTVSANDLGNKTAAVNDSTFFTYNELKAMVIAPDNLTWSPLYSGDLNQTSINDPTTINNTGNYNGTVDLTALDLAGETSPEEVLPANNFTASILTGSSIECLGQALANSSLITVTSSVANRGNLSAGSGIGQEDLYYCIPIVPSISSQTYSTLLGGSWTVGY